MTSKLEKADQATMILTYIEMTILLAALIITLRTVLRNV